MQLWQTRIIPVESNQRDELVKNYGVEILIAHVS